jgi:hypothetical protein
VLLMTPRLIVASKATTAITVSNSRSVNAGEWRCGRAGGMGKGRGRE